MNSINQTSPTQVISAYLKRYLGKIRPVKPINQSLLRQAHALLNAPQVSEILSAQCERELGGQNSKVSTAIHPADQMLTHSIRVLEDVNQSISQYFCVALQQYRALERMLRLAFPHGLQDKLILDFACGYGRALRFLVQSCPARQIWASDIQEDAVNFVRDQFGVNALVSDASPAQFQPGRKFQFIWVASLFTHLPERLFRAWLVRLYELLTDDGFLVFSVHDESILPAGMRLADNGFLFAPESEISALDSAVYGTTHVSESFVRSVLVHSLAHPDGGYLRVPRGLADQQDLYVVPKRQQSLERFDAYRQGAWGWVERAIAYGVTQDAPTVLADVSGWAKSLDRDSSVKAVYAEVGGVRYQATLGIRRPDLAKAWATDFENYGWELRFPIPRATTSFVSVMAQLDSGECGLIYFGVLDPKQLLELAPWGYLDAASVQDGHLHLGGWAAASSGRKIAKVVATIDRVEYRAVLGDARQDVCEVLRDEGYRHSGWHVDVPAAGLRSPVEARVVAVAEDGAQRPLFEGPIDLNSK
jgi:SAM-dependent methyltransferase